MPPSLTTIDISGRADVAGLKETFTQNGRLQIRNILETPEAKDLQVEVNQLPWRLVLNENGKHLDIHPLQLKQIPPIKLREIKRAAQLRASREFQYLFENYPVHDLVKSKKPITPFVESVYKALNAPEFLTELSLLTERPIDFCDMQATRYRAGHFLTTHDDGIAGKNRQLAYVLNLSERWRESWGGCLEFTSKTGARVTQFLPVFNSLSLFSVPQDHAVTRVKPSAKSSRLALTGWFRTRS